MTRTKVAPPAEEHAGFAAGMGALARCAARTVSLVAHRKLHQPTGNVGRRVRWSDGTTSMVYRETTADHDPVEPCTLVVRFRLRGVRRPLLHALFRLESELNTVLFAGFPGFVSKLWFAADEQGTYRGLYDWDGVENADAYVRALWWALMVVADRSSIEHVVVAGVRRDQLLRDPAVAGDDRVWWHPLDVNPLPVTAGRSATG
jgi:hypothetical protein